MIIVGIDTARGWAVAFHRCGKDKKWYPERQILNAGTVNGLEEMIDVIARLNKEYFPDLIRIEKSNSRHVYSRPGANAKQMKNIAVKVGENRAKADAIFYFCKGLGVPAEYITPIKNGTKLSRQQIKQLTGYDASASEHARDAVVIAWCKPVNKRGKKKK